MQWQQCVARDLSGLILPTWFAFSSAQLPTRRARFPRTSRGSPLFTYGDLPRNSLRGPGINNWDISLVKTTKITESKSLEFRSEFFNTFNHVQYYRVDDSGGSPTFGQVLADRGPRIIQLALKFLFLSDVRRASRLGGDPDVAQAENEKARGGWITSGLFFHSTPDKKFKSSKSLYLPRPMGR